MAAPLDNDPGAETAAVSKPSRGKRRSWIWTTLLVVQIAAVLGSALGAAGIWFCIKKYEAGLPSAEMLRSSYRPAQVTRVLARDGTVSRKCSQSAGR